MIGYSLLGTNDMARARAFYDALFGAMNFTPIAEGIQKAAQGNVDLAERFRDALQFFQTDVARGNRFHNAVRSRCSGFSHIP